MPASRRVAPALFVLLGLGGCAPGGCPPVPQVEALVKLQATPEGVVIPVVLNGVTMPMIVDTGLENTMVKAAAVKAAAVKAAALETAGATLLPVRPSQVTGIGGQSFDTVGQRDTLKIGGARVTTA